MDYAIHITACKHIHAVHQQISTTDPSQAIELEDAVTTIDSNSQHEVPSMLIPVPKPGGSLNQFKREFQILLDEANTIVYETDSCDVLKSGLAHLRSSISVMRLTPLLAERD